jgi:hypothetical protein
MAAISSMATSGAWRSLSCVRYRFPDDAAQGYLGREIEAGVFFGIDKHVLSALPYRSQATRPELAAGLFDLLSSRQDLYLSRRAAQVSAGRDGTLLLDRRVRRHVLLRPRGDA